MKIGGPGSCDSEDKNGRRGAGSYLRSNSCDSGNHNNRQLKSPGDWAGQKEEWMKKGEGEREIRAEAEGQKEPEVQNCRARSLGKFQSPQAVRTEGFRPAAA